MKHISDLMKFSLVVAVDKQNGIGKNNTLPWRLPSDLKHFSKITTETKQPGKQNVVIMGRKTWESLPEKRRPLPDRHNIVISGQKDFPVPVGVGLADSLASALSKAESQGNIESSFVIGGGKVFAEAINHPDCDKIYLTQIQQSFDCDALFPAIDLNKFKLIESADPAEENGIKYQFLTYQHT